MLNLSKMPYPLPDYKNFYPPPPPPFVSNGLEDLNSAYTSGHFPNYSFSELIQTSHRLSLKKGGADSMNVDVSSQKNAGERPNVSDVSNR